MISPSSKGKRFHNSFQKSFIYVFQGKRKNSSVKKYFKVRLFSKKIIFFNKFIEHKLIRLIGAEGARLLREQRDR